VRPLDRRLLSSARSARGHLVAAGAVTTLAALLVLAQAFVVAELVVRPFQQGADVAALRAPLLVLAGVVLGRALLAWAAEVSAHRISAEVKYSLRQRLLEHVARLGPAWLSGKATGEIATLATRGTDALDAYFARYLPAAISAAVVPPVVVAVVLSQDLLAGLIILATLPLVPVFAILVGTSTQRRARSRWRTLSTLGAHFLDVVEGLPTLLVFRRARAQVETIRRVTEEYRRATMATLRVAFLSSAVLEFVATISVALVAVSTGLRLVGGTVDLRTGLVVIVLAPEAYWPLRQLAVHFHDSADGLAAAERVFAILDTPVAPRGSTPVGVRCDLTRSSIRVEALTVTYGRSSPALAALDLTVAPGEYLGIAGPSGCGKSTLLGVLLGFVQPSSGRVLLGGTGGTTDLTRVDPDDWRAQISWVPQRPWLAATSVDDNVRMARPDADDAAVATALHLAHATGFVEALPRGGSTVLGEGGAGLSAGERQRIALARAFLRDAPLVLLDEPTAHLDPVSEAAVAAAVRRLARDRTVVAVAHRPALLADADRVVWLDGCQPGGTTVSATGAAS
jgi:thiol reductant ABC exporter CydD subunit